MHPLRLSTLALLLGVVTASAVCGQPYGPTRYLQPCYDADRDYGYDRDYEYAPTPRIDVGFFYDELSPYGDWVLTRSHGWAWFPRNVHPYWRPYVEGRWVTTEYGWTWVSHEPFGWATYHYGRWAWDPRFGWLWVPGTEWGPAWVSWQYGGGYAGWAPLPPAVGFEVGIGIRIGSFDMSIGIRPDAYNFVPVHSIFEPNISRHRLPTARNVTIIHNTTNITSYTYVDNRVVNRGPEYRAVEQATGRPVRQLRVTEAQSKTRTEATNTEVRIYRAEKQKLDTVRAAPRTREQQPATAPGASRSQDRPREERGEAPEVVVAPRADRAPKPDVRQLEKQESRQKQELKRYQMEEKRKLERLHQQEAAKVKAQADRNEVEKRHRAESEALEQGQRDAAQQLTARQQAQRKAALADPPDEGKARGGKKEADAQEKKKEREKSDPDNKDKGGGGRAW